MSIYQSISEIGSKFIKQHTLFKYGFNMSPMYRRSTARITSVSEDLLHITIRLPISFKNKNYVSSIFGGSLFSAVDPIPMVKLMKLLGNEYVVWDKSAEVYFKRPAKENLVATFTYTLDELQEIKNKVSEEKEIEIQKHTVLTNTNETTIFCEVKKTIYIADKEFYKKKRERAKIKK